MVSEKIIGKKGTFAIAYNIQSVNSHIMGSLCLWVDNKYIGAFEDINPLSATLYQLKKMTPYMLDGEQFRGVKEYEVYQIIKSGKVSESDKYFQSFGEAFDDFSIIAYSLDGFMNFIWRLLEAPFFTYKNYPEGLQFAKIPIDDLAEVVARFENELTCYPTLSGNA